MAEDNETNVDRISKLPDDVIYHIFSFLPTIYLLQMSLLSKRWRLMSVSTPFIHWIGRSCDYYPFKKLVKKRDFFNTANNNLERRKLHMQVSGPHITSLKYDIDYILNRKDRRRVDDWLSFAIQSEVKELDLRVQLYTLPELVLNSCSITLLKLNQLKLEVPSVSALPSLKVLCLKYVNSDAKSLRNLISGCTIIEYLKLIDAGTSLDFDVSKTLKHLRLKREYRSLGFTKQWLEGLVSGLPLLESFDWILHGAEFDTISIHSHSLKSLSVRNKYSASGRVFTEASIRTPNLTFLHFEFVFKSVISIEAPNLSEAKLTLTHMYPYGASYDDLMHFLSNFSDLKKLVLVIDSTQDFRFLSSN
ncbi:hypothetical protein FNV43_RR19777 [Rhamnella rubrinervis]|uniref:F-box domain-containing protein n=1 Tax=Rhamnella rubrinervis TaxID=2594499 RepID=A0A8K0DZF4_9ROSA|nr:hypothetical protein FNV43_RR19777 [Rhamnella rubrinervis]